MLTPEEQRRADEVRRFVMARARRRYYAGEITAEDYVALLHTSREWLRTGAPESPPDP